MTDMTKAEVLAIWKGLVKHMTDQGAVVPFAHEIARRVRNGLLDRLEAAEKERNAAKLMSLALRAEIEELHALIAAVKKQANAEFRIRVKKEEACARLQAKIAEMERQEPVAGGDVGRAMGASNSACASPRHLP